jgi:hypothetical protein
MQSCIEVLNDASTAIKLSAMVTTNERYINQLVAGSRSVDPQGD